MSRANVPEHERKDFSLYVDEFQNFSTDSFATIMSEARKYHLNLIVANQFTTQLTDEIRDAVFGNMGTIVAFRIGQNDVEALGRYFQPTFDGDDILRVPNYNTIIRTLVGGVPTQPFSMATLPPLGDPNPKLAAALKQLSAAKYGHPKATVEKDIFARMATKAAPSPAAPPAPSRMMQPGMAPASSPWASSAGAPARPLATQAPSSSPFNSSLATPPQPMPAKSPSFLDEWLSKRTKSAAPSLKTEKAEIEKEQREQLRDDAPQPSSVVKPTEFSRQEKQLDSTEPREEKHETHHHKKKHGHDTSDFEKRGAPKNHEPKHEDREESIIEPPKKQPDAPAKSETAPIPPAPKVKEPAHTEPAPPRLLEDELSHGDTIYIDQEGNMHVGGQKPGEQ